MKQTYSLFFCSFRGGEGVLLNSVVLRQVRWKHLVRLNILVLLAAGGLVGCGSSKKPDQLIVTGDKFEITLQEYEQLLNRVPPVKKEAVAPLRRALLQQLIDEKLLAEAATSAGMEDDPTTSQAIAASLRNILAQAYIRKLTGNIPKPDMRDVEKYYNAHPIMFADRRKFLVEEYVLQSDVPDINIYLDALDKKDFDTLSAIIAEKMPGLTPMTVARFSNELPDSNNMLRQLVVGSNIVYQSPGQVHLGIVRSVSVEPLTLEEARSRIEQSLAGERSSAITEAAVKGLRGSRHIEIINANLREASAADLQKATKP